MSSPSLRVIRCFPRAVLLALGAAFGCSQNDGAGVNLPSSETTAGQAGSAGQSNALAGAAGSAGTTLGGAEATGGTDGGGGAGATLGGRGGSYSWGGYTPSADDPGTDGD